MRYDPVVVQPMRDELTVLGPPKIAKDLTSAFDDYCAVAA